MSTISRLAVKVSSSGRTERVDLGDDDYPVIEAAVQGDFEVLSLAPDLDMWANENGLAVFSPLFDRNPLAEAMQMVTLGAANLILGPVIFTGGIGRDGETLALPEGRALEVERMASTLRGEA